MIRDALNYLLDPISFLALTANRHGYDNSTVIDTRIASMYTLEGVASPFEVIDFRFEVALSMQKQRITN